MKCQNCGAESNGKFCEHCGSPMEQIQTNEQSQSENSNQTVVSNTNAENQTIASETPAKIKKPIYKKWWFWLIIVIVIFGAANMDGAESPEKESAKNDDKEVVEIKKEEVKETFGINETAVFKDLKITANEIKESTGATFFKAEDGRVFVGVQFTIENTSNEEEVISSILLFDAYLDGVKSDISVEAIMAFDSGTIDGTLAPGKKLVGWYAVDAPNNWSELELQVKDTWLSSKKAIFVFNK